MAVTSSVSNYLYVDDCEDYTTWSGESPANVTDFYKEGTQCVGFTVRGAGNNDITVSGSWNLSGKHLRCWMMTVALSELDTDANGGIQFILGDGTNTGYYKVSGSTTYPGGWYNLVLDCDRTPDSGSQPTLTAITLIGIRFVHTGTAKNVQNTWIDNVYCADGIVIYGTLTSPFDFDDILAEDENTSNGWGIIRKISGIYYLVGSITFGDNSGTGELDFKDSSQVIIFENRPVDANLYNFTVVANATGSTQKFQLGDKAGTAGVSGCIIRTQSTTQTPKFDVICTDTDVDDFKLYGCSFLDADSISLPTYSTTREVISCSFEECGEVLADTCTVYDCKFVSADDRGIRASTASHNIENCTFVTCPAGIHIPLSTSIDFSDILFIGSDGASYYDVEHSVSGTLTINAEDSNFQYVEETGGGSTNIVNSVTLAVHVEDEDGNNIQNAQVAIFKTSDDSQLMNEDTDVNGDAEESFNYLSDTAIYIRVRKSSTGTTRYFPFRTTGTITANGFTLDVILIQDGIVAA